MCNLVFPDLGQLLSNLMGNEDTQIFNRTLLSMLRTEENSQKADWKRHISSLGHAYNSTVNATTVQRCGLCI